MATSTVLERKKKKPISIQGARVHNLKNISLDLPRNKFIVITGLSGSGKSSLAFDTLYAEGQRRYVESLSAYARQFLGKIDKPDVDDIKGISPAIAIEQKVISKNPRSTVGTITEVYDYLKLLFARIGRTYSPISGEEVKRDTVTDVVDYIQSFPDSTKGILYTPLKVREGREIAKQLELFQQQGYSRVKQGAEILRIDDLLSGEAPASEEDLDLIIDRFSSKPGDEDNESRLADSAQTSFYEGHGICHVEMYPEGQDPIRRNFSDKAEKDGITFEEPTTNFFSFNSPLGACPTCEGFGSVMGVDEDLVISNKNLSVYEDAIVCWNGEKMRKWKDRLIKNAHNFDFPVHRPIKDLTPEEKELLWTGNEHFKGLNAFFKHLEKKSYKIQFRVMLSRYRGKTSCPECKGSRLRKEVRYVKIDNHTIIDVIEHPITKVYEMTRSISLTKYEKEVANRLLEEINNRLDYLINVGLGYLTLNRRANTLSGGESQRINLARSLGSSLVGSMYILDEPSIGLHPRDNERLIKVLTTLRDIGNTVITVEHDEDIMKAADRLVDLGPEAGTHGGALVFEGDHEALLHSEDSLTAQYLTGKKAIPVPESRRSGTGQVTIQGARQHNLKDIDVDIPLQVLSVITGVSGSGKTTLVKDLLYPALQKRLGGYGDKTGEFDGLEGDVDEISHVEMVDQSPIGRSSRSNPVTYVKAFDEIRQLLSEQPIADARKYKPKTFSFNVEGGRCDVCEGEGVVKVEMQFMADIVLTCEACKGKRYKKEVLEVEYRDKNISDLLEMTVDDAMEFFKTDEKNNHARKIVDKLHPLQETGLGYVKLGQSSSTLSGGEAQRIKLASFLGKGKQKNGSTLFIFDEPTTGLHFHDIGKLLHSMEALIQQGNTVLIIEHDLDIIKCADHLIDLGPEGGEEGGSLVFEGTPEDLIKEKGSYTAKYLKGKLT